MKTRIFLIAAGLFVAVSSAFGQTSPDQRQVRLLQASCRQGIYPGQGSLILGFKVNSSEPRRFLIRAGGPILKNFRVENACEDPVLSVHRIENGIAVLVAYNDNWQALPGEEDTYGFASPPFPVGSKDSAMIVSLESGDYTATVNSFDQSGIVLAEVYDLEHSASLSNVSARGMVTPGSGALILGYVIEGTRGIGNILLRAAGPSLSQFGIKDYLEDPTIELWQPYQTLGFNDDWQPSFSNGYFRYMAGTGIFPFIEGAKDAALLDRSGYYSTRDPARFSFTATVTGKTAEGAGTGSGIALIELYFWVTER